MKYNLLVNKRKCINCNNNMNLNKSSDKKDGLIWRCRHLGNNKHDNKINIRVGSIFEFMKNDIRILYFIIFYNFIERRSIKQTHYNCIEFSKKLNLETISKKNISKFMNIIRIKINNFFHAYWNINQIGIETTNDGKIRLEVDESKIITYDNQVRWMLGIVDRGSKEIRVFYLNNDRTKKKIMPIIIKNIYTPQNIIYNNTNSDSFNPATRIYTDC